MVAPQDREVAVAARLNNQPKLSIVVPVLNEYPHLPEIMTQLAELVSQQGIDVVFVDGGSCDGSAELLQNMNEEFLSFVKSEQGRALQMNAGAEIAKGELLLFLHADTRLSQANIQDLFHSWHSSEHVWGRFDLAFDLNGLRPGVTRRQTISLTTSASLRVIAWFINLRSRLTGIATGDQAIFVNRDVFDKVGCFEKQPLMEDIELSRQLGAHSKPLCLRSKIITSPRKWQQEGLVRTVLLMWAIRLKYFLGVSAEQLVKDYYRK